MYKIFFIFFTLFFISCSSTTKLIKPNEKVFEEEDQYILFALRGEQVGNYNVAGEIFYKLYEKSIKREYLYRCLENYLLAKKYDKVISIVDNLDIEDFKLKRLKIIALFENNNLTLAKQLAVKLVRKTKEVDDYLLLGDILIKEKKYDLALKYLEGAYVKEYNEKILDKISIILYINLDRKKDAIAQLESHSRIHGCSELICNRLLGIYSNENNIDGLLSIYLRLYELKRDIEISKKIVQIYRYKRDYISLMSFLEKYHADDNLLLNLYLSAKSYTKAYKLAYKIYEDSSNISYLGKSAIYEYEACKDNLSKNILNDIIKKLKKIPVDIDDGVYMNYLGYILIDHNIDVKDGIKYIKDVLNYKPDVAYYLDSLAWGYYKQNNCVKAKKVMEKVFKIDVKQDKELLEHLKKIEKCLKNSKGVK